MKFLTIFDGGLLIPANWFQYAVITDGPVDNPHQVTVHFRNDKGEDHLKKWNYKEKESAKEVVKKLADDLKLYGIDKPRIQEELERLESL